MKRHAQNDKLVLNADILAAKGFGEIVGGSQREDDYNILEARMKHENMNMDDFGWYLDLRKYGTVPHSGFGIGIDRLVALLTEAGSIRETISFPLLKKEHD